MTPKDNPTWGGKRKAGPGKKIGKPRLHPDGLRRFYISLSPDDLAWLDEQAGELGTRAGVVRRLIDEARAGPWRPIETAPKDGTVIILWAPEATIAMQGYEIRFQVAIGAWEAKDWRTLLGFFRYISPTHWMPLPEPPAAPEPGEAEGE